VLQCVAVCCSVLQCVVGDQVKQMTVDIRNIVCCSVLQCVAVCCSVLQCVAVCCGGSSETNDGRHSQYSVLQCAAVCCSM